MHISKIIIDGFKSYASRTVLSGFDKSFNAITGLNGSGKSNILDAICFVLGISNLSQVRVNNLQELVFKGGQAGVTKASVTITFDNSERSSSPVGYEDCSEITVARQVVIGGRNKYLINGKTAQLNRVQNLFLSVQLNVNNPHFLIMQGRITKVLNMKPPEILSMIEEAAGTRLYEMKKVAAQNTILKKDKKLEEIGRVLNEEIIPTLEKLKGERAKYIQWSQGRTEIEKLERYCVAYQYTTCSAQSEKAKRDVQQLEQELESMQQKCTESQSLIKSIQKTIDQKRRSKQKDIENDFANLEKKVAELSKTLVQLNSQYEHVKDSMDTEVKKRDKLRKQVDDEKQSLETNRVKLQSANEILTTYKNRVDQCSTNVTNLNKQYEAVYAGLAVDNDSTNGRTLTEQLIECKTKDSQLKTEQEQTVLKLNHLRRSLEKKKQDLTRASSNDTEMQHRVATLESVVTNFTNELNNHTFDQNGYEQHVKQLNQLQTSLEEVTNQINELRGELTVFALNYDKRVVDPSKVKGLVADLFKIKDPQTSIALEVTAGNKLIQLVVDTEQTATQLIKNGKFDKRVTVIPLNKIKYGTLPKSVLDKATAMGADLALVLVEYDRSVDPAMQYTFGQTLVCDTLERAKKVAFDPEVFCKTVTHDGDSFDPRGTLTGGSRRTDASNSPLLKLDKLHALEAKRVEIEKQIRAVKQHLDDNQGARRQRTELMKKIDLKKHELKLLQKNMEQGRSSVLQKEIGETETEIVQCESKIENLKEQQTLNNDQMTHVEQQLEQFKSTSQNKEATLKQIEKNTREAKRLLQQARNEFSTKESDRDRLVAQITAQEEEIQQLEEQLNTVQQSIDTELRKEVQDAESKALSTKEQYDSLQQKLANRQKEMAKADKELAQLVKQKEELEQAETERNLEIKKAQHKMTRLQKVQKDTEAITKNLLNIHTWIPSEEHLFNKPNSEYDFRNSRETAEELKVRLESLKNEHQKLSKTVNKKVMTMYEKAEQDYLNLVKKRGIVDKDKSKIEQTIHELDEKKKQAIRKTWTKVNQDFGSIFSTLLPGTTAKLEPASEGDEGVMDGLEVKVAFGNVWKQSLAELSGGQRSLLALSLILALLLFKPAPMYILDEIDAALDPSHTQNIGRMLKTHFANSQFIVVSLKEGMFQNANVLFKTKFVNGQSAVNRIAGHSSAVDMEAQEAAAVAHVTRDQLRLQSSVGDGSNNQRQQTEQHEVDDDASDDDHSTAALLLSPTPVQKSRKRSAPGGTASNRGKKRTRLDL